jgi:hypothetical protein
MNKNEYLSDYNVSGFIRFLRQEVVPGNVLLPFFPAAHINRFDAQLRNGYKNYLWHGHGFTETAQLLGEFSIRLNNGLEENDNYIVSGVVGDILRWGLMPKAAAHNINTYNMIGMNGLREAVGILLSETPDLDGFGRLPYNSGFTKIYAMIKPDMLPIYDSRVSAMIGYLAAVYCQKNDFDNIPDELLLYCMPFHANRRPSYAGVNFPTTNNNGIRHASGAIRCGWILNAIKDDIADNWGVEQALCVRAAESAFFYAGGRVIDVPRMVALD